MFKPSFNEAFVRGSKLKKLLKTKFVGSNIFWFEKVSSTNDVAYFLLKRGFKEGLVVLADTQTQGRGRKGKNFFSPKGGLWLSIIFSPSNPETIYFIQYLLCIAVSLVLKEFLGVKTAIKWPNDVLIEEKKVCGVLVENKFSGNILEAAIGGIGLNINFPVESFPHILRKTATTLYSELKHEIDFFNLCKKLLEKIDSLYFSLEKGGKDKLLKLYRELSPVFGRKVKIRNREVVEGLALTLSPKGGLLIKKLNGEIVEVFEGSIVNGKGQN